MTSQRIRRSVIIYATVVGLFSLTVFYVAFHLMFSGSMPTTGLAGVLRFLQFVLFTFVLPLALLALCWSLSYRLVRRWRIGGIFAVGMVMVAGIFLSRVAETTLRELLPSLLSSSHKMWKLLAFGAGGGIKMGVLFGALAGAKANWTEPQP